MATGKEKSAEQAKETVKPKRRGISNETRTTSKRRLSDNYIDVNTGLIMIEPINISVGIHNYKEGKDNDFAGLEVPVLNIEFKTSAGDDKTEYYTETFKPIPSNVTTIPGGKSAWKVDAMFAKLKHFIDVIALNGKELTSEQEEKLELGFVDFDDDGGYQIVEKEDVVSAYGTLFNNVAEILNSPTSFTTKNPDGTKARYYGKFIRYTKSKGKITPVDNEQLSLPTFVGEGIIERVVKDKTPAIRIDSTREIVKTIPDFKQTNDTNNMIGSPVNGMTPSPTIAVSAVNYGMPGNSADAPPF